MPHDIKRVLRAFASRAWFIEPQKMAEIIAMLELRAALGPRTAPYRTDGPARRHRPLVYIGLRDSWYSMQAFDDEETAEERRQRRNSQSVAAASGSGGEKRVAVLRLYGTIAPRMEALDDISATAATMVDFQAMFRQVANDPSVGSIVIDIDSPGGAVDLVPETAAMIREARREDRPITAVANTLAASAAYWLASAADELVVTPSGAVGSIGVYTAHEDISEALAKQGVTVTLIHEGPRKVEANPFEPLSPEAMARLQADVHYYYDMFTSDVAKARGVPVSVVRADPEKAEQHFGGGRVLQAKPAVAAGMADRVATLDDVVADAVSYVQRGGKRKRKSAELRRRLAIA